MSRFEGTDRYIATGDLKVAVNAAVVGLLLATWLGLLRPSLTSASDVLIALLAAWALLGTRVPPWAVALGCALAAAAVQLLAGR